MCLFRPFIDSAFTGFDIDPRATCLEAAQSIVNLNETHAATGAGRGAILVPHMQCVAGLMIDASQDEGGRCRLGADALSQKLAVEAGCGV